MKAKNLEIMQRNGINIPKFIVLDSINCNNIPNDIDITFSNSKYFAVRSSSYSEDGTKHSHAGEFKTILNVPRENIVRAVQEVAQSYKSIPGQIIIQEMINSDISGVLFTANPLGILSQMCITIGFGTGDNVVDNKIETTSYIYDLEEKCAYKTGGSENSAELGAIDIERLANIGRRIENIFNTKCDIEFAIENNIVYILQARPITTLTGNSIVLDSSNIVESYPGVSLPLTQGFVKDIYYKIFEQLVNHIIGNRTYKVGSMVTCVNWHFYYIISDWYTLLLKLPFSKKIIKTWQKMLGVSNKEVISNNDKLGIITQIKVMVNFIVALFKVDSNMNRLNNNFEYSLDQFRLNLEAENTVSGLMSLYRNAKEYFLKDWYVTLINDIYTFIFVALVKDKRYISNIKNIESGRQTIELNKLVLEYKKHKGEGGELDSKIEAYIQKYGDRVPGELKLETETFRTNKNKLLEYLSNAHYNENLIHEINIKKSSGLQGFFASKARKGITNREISRFNRSRLFGFTRDIFLKIGSILLKYDQISNQNDVFYLTEDEIVHGTNLDNIVKDRKAQEIKFKHYKMPRRLIIDRMDIVEIQSMMTGKSNIMEGMQTVTGNIQGEIVSRAHGFKEVTGEVIVLDTPDINIDTTDKIIVTSMTDPGWSTIIKNSKAIITEQGSLLSHTAIISREFNKPSIVNVRDATQLLHTGDMVSLDMITGGIRIVDKAN